MSIFVSNVSYAYAGKMPTLDNVSTHFRSTELSFIAGSSGSGKTTLIRCINGLIPHRYSRGTMSGFVFLDGDRVLSLSLLQVAERVGTVMQDPARQMVATHAMDEIAFGLENLAQKSARELRRTQINSASAICLTARPRHLAAASNRKSPSPVCLSCGLLRCC